MGRLKQIQNQGANCCLIRDSIWQRCALALTGSYVSNETLFVLLLLKLQLLGTLCQTQPSAHAAPKRADTVIMISAVAASDLRTIQNKHVSQQIISPEHKPQRESPIVGSYLLVH